MLGSDVGVVGVSTDGGQGGVLVLPLPKLSAEDPDTGPAPAAGPDPDPGAEATRSSDLEVRGCCRLRGGAY